MSVEFSPEVFTAICERIAAGESLRAICGDEGMPAKSSVLRWLDEPRNQDLRDQYARARERQADTYAEEVVEISDEECTTVRADKHGAKADDPESGEVEVVFDATAVARNRLRVDARKWAASKLAPKKYGDRVTHAGDPEAPIGLEHSGSVTIDPGEAYRRMLDGD